MSTTDPDAAPTFLPDGAILALDFERPQEAIADAFDADAVRAAVLGAQQGRVMYPEFNVRSPAVDM